MKFVVLAAQQFFLLFFFFGCCSHNSLPFPFSVSLWALVPPHIATSPLYVAPFLCPRAVSAVVTLTAEQHRLELINSFKNVLHWSRSVGGVERTTALYTHLHVCGESLCMDNDTDFPPWSIHIPGQQYRHLQQQQPQPDSPPQQSLSFSRISNSNDVAQPLAGASSSNPSEVWVEAETEALPQTYQFSNAVVAAVAVADTPGGAAHDETYEFVGHSLTSWKWSKESVGTRRRSTLWGTASWWSAGQGGKSTAVVGGRCNALEFCYCAASTYPYVVEFLEWGVVVGFAMPDNKEDEFRELTVIFDDDLRFAQVTFLERNSCTLKILDAGETEFLRTDSGFCGGCVGAGWVSCSTAQYDPKEVALEDAGAVCETLNALVLNEREIVYVYTLLLTTAEEQIAHFGKVYEPDAVARVQRYRRYTRENIAEEVQSPSPTYVAFRSLTGEAIDVAQNLSMGPDAADLVVAWQNEQLVSVGTWNSRSLFHGEWLSEGPTATWWNALTLVRGLQWDGQRFLQVPPLLNDAAESITSSSNLLHDSSAAAPGTVTLHPGDPPLCWKIEALGKMAVAWDLPVQTVPLNANGRVAAGLELQIGENPVTGLVVIQYDPQQCVVTVDRGQTQLNLQVAHLLPKIETQLEGELARLVVVVDRSVIEVFPCERDGCSSSVVLTYSLRSPRSTACLQGFVPTATVAASPSGAAGPQLKSVCRIANGKVAKIWREGLNAAGILYNGSGIVVLLAVCVLLLV